jgi:nanoRNase/pAp phosphatase (c-di-AMP/oligoRNAs hydrolase)
MSSNDFLEFLEAMRGRRLLHVAHRDADCDALGSAYALSRLLPGDVGAAQGLKASARDLAEALGFTPLIDPDPAAYDYTVIYDTPSLDLLGLPLPARYALFDHHTTRWFRHGEHDFHSELAEGAEWAWVAPRAATSALLVDLFIAHGLPIDREMGLALGAGIVTDTEWLKFAGPGSLRSLAALLEAAEIRMEDVLATVDGPRRSAARRSAALAALRGVQEHQVGPGSLLVTRTDSHDHGFVVIAALLRLGGDLAVVSFPKDERSMVMVESSPTLAAQAGLDLEVVAGEVAESAGGGESWGTPTTGRVIAALDEGALRALTVQHVVNALEAGGKNL